MAGNKTFRLDPELLRHYRELAGKSQTNVATELRDNPDSSRAAVTTYQRLERTGKTTRVRAQRIAKILGIPLELLVDNSSKRSVGPIGPLATQIKDACQRLVDSGSLKKLLQVERDKAESGDVNYEWALSPLIASDEASGAQSLTTEATYIICDHIERYSLSAKQDVNDPLFDLLGVEKEHRHDPLIYKGLWFVQDSSDNAFPGQIFHGLIDAFEAVSKRLNSHKKIAIRARLTTDENAYRLTFSHQFKFEDFWIEITRCTASPDNSGIRFVSPTDYQKCSGTCLVH
jgi:transcriptional regulator with XRE-family HTH domain